MPTPSPFGIMNLSITLWICTAHVQLKAIQFQNWHEISIMTPMYFMPKYGFFYLQSAWKRLLKFLLWFKEVESLEVGIIFKSILVAKNMRIWNWIAFSFLAGIKDSNIRFPIEGFEIRNTSQRCHLLLLLYILDTDAELRNNMIHMM